MNSNDKNRSTPAALADVVALARTDLQAVYGMDDVRLPVVAVDGRGRALVLNRDGRLLLATKARPGGHAFDEVVTV